MLINILHKMGWTAAYAASNVVPPLRGVVVFWWPECDVAQQGGSSSFGGGREIDGGVGL